MAVYRTTFAVEAPVERVWEVLTDFDRWAEWNPSVPSIEGEPRVGSTVTLTLAMPGRPSAKVKAALTEVVPERRLVWDGTVGPKWLFAGHREFLIEPQPDGTVASRTSKMSAACFSHCFVRSWEALSGAATRA